jgi:hypothetical protein
MTSEHDDLRSELSRLANEVPTGDADTEGIARRAKQRRFHKRMALSTSTLGLAVVLMATTLLPPTSPIGGSNLASAAEALRRLATVSAQQQGEVPGPGEYYFIQEQSTFTNHEDGFWRHPNQPPAYTFLETDSQLYWASPNDYSGRILGQVSNITYPTAGDKAAWEAAGSPHANYRSDEVCSPGGLTPTDPLASVPTDPAKLVTFMERSSSSANGDDGPGLMRAFSELINENEAVFNLSPDHRAAIFTAVSGLQGITFDSDAKDASGRTGYGFSYQADGYTHTMLFNPITGEFLADRWADSTGSYETDVMQVGVADSVTSMPSGESIPWSADLPKGIESEVGVCAPVGHASP